MFQQAIHVLFIDMSGQALPYFVTRMESRCT